MCMYMYVYLRTCVCTRVHVYCIPGSINTDFEGAAKLPKIPALTRFESRTRHKFILSPVTFVVWRCFTYILSFHSTLARIPAPQIRAQLCIHNPLLIPFFQAFSPSCSAVSSIRTHTRAISNAQHTRDPLQYRLHHTWSPFYIFVICIYIATSALWNVTLIWIPDDDAMSDRNTLD
jgi:hypothetical protein